MATYFHGNTEIQSTNSGHHQDGLQTLVLMNPTGYIPYSDTPPPPPHQPSSAAGTGNLVFLNSAAATLAHHNHNPHAPPQHQQQHFLSSNSGGGGGDMSGFHHGFHPQRVHYNVWTPPPETPSPSARDTPRAGTPLQQGLSLTLSSQQLGFGSPHAPPHSGEDARGVSVASSAVSGVTTGGGAAGMQSVLLSSKYLRAAQELLEEVVNVGAGIGGDISGKKAGGGGSGGSKSVGESSGATASGDGGKRSSPAELTPAERQEVQMKKAKLIAMLDEVEQRYRQYHQQMQIVICSFEQAAGMGSARTYTALALQTISKQFRCLKDAIAGQIRAAGKSLGEETDGGGGSGGAGSRLKFVDHHLRQQRALQQLGMIQHNAWRPQRGLPERSVSVLRAWLFEHFLHPYPKDSDKHMLAKQTGLTRSQVSNWFINARVRLWKPMVEEMYLEEIKEQNGGQAGDNKVDNSSDASKSSPTAAIIEARDNNNIDPSPSGGFSLVGSSELDGIALARNSPKKARCGDGDGDALTSPNAHHHARRHLTVDVKPDEDNNEGEDEDDDDNNQVSMGRDGYSFMGGHQTNFIGGFGQYPIAEIGRPFDVASAADPFTPRYSGGGDNGNSNNNSNGFSLTLGLPNHLSLSGGSHHHHHHQGGFVPAGPVIQLGGGGGGGGIRRVDHLHHHHMGEVGDQFGSINASPHPHSSSAAAAAFDAINIQNPKRFAAQLLPDYVS